MISPELVEQGWYDCDALVLDYYAKTEASHGWMPLKIDWNAYRRMENKGNCCLFTARGQQLDGFSLYIVSQHLHHPRHKVAACSILAVRPEARGEGLGTKLVEFAMPWLKTHGCTHITHSFRTLYNTEPLFPKLGFKLVEQTYARELP